MSAVTVPELTNYLSGMRVTNVQAVAAELVLDGVQAELERYLNRPIQERRVLEELPVEGGFVYVSVTPIKALYGVFRSGDDGEVDRTRTVPGIHYRRGGNFLNLGYSSAPVGPEFGYPTVWVDYMGGINADLDPGMKLAIIRVAAREFMHHNEDAMTVENTEARPTSDPTPQPKGWQEQELVQFDRLRRRVIL